MTSAETQFGPPSLFHITVDFVCDGTQELPNFSGLPETLLQLIFARILCSGQHAAGIKLLRQPSLFTNLELPASLVINDEWLEAVGSQAPTLEALTIENCSAITPQGVGLLHKLMRLKRLHLCDLACWSPAATASLVSMPELKHLHLEGQPGVIVLDEAMCACLGSLQGLDHLALVGASGLCVGHCKQVGQMCPNLECMDMSESDIQDDGLSCLLQPLRQLHTVTLKGCAALTDECTRAIASLPQLSSLDLARTAVGDWGVSLLQSMKKLQKLILCGTKVTDRSLDVINTSMQALTELDLSCKRVSDVGLRKLRNLSNLTTLNLSYTQVSDDGMLALRRLPRLANLSLRWTRITDWALGSLTNNPEATPVAEPEPLSCKTLSLQRVGRSSAELPLRRSKSSVDSLNPAQQRRDSQRLRNRLSRSGDYSQVLSRCRATMDFTATRVDSFNNEAPDSPPSSPGDEPAAPNSASLALAASVSSAFVVPVPPNNTINPDLSPPASSQEPEVPDIPNCFEHALSHFDDMEEPIYREPYEITEGEIEPETYRSIEIPDCSLETLDEEEVKGLYTLNAYEPMVARCVEPEDFPEASMLSWESESNHQTLMCQTLPTNSTLCAPSGIFAGFSNAPVEEVPTNSTLCAPSGIFGRFNSAPAEDHEDDVMTLEAMRVLDLSVTDIADTGLSFLSAFSNITSLNLFSTKVTDDGLKHVAKLDNLVDLDLCGTEVSDEGLKQIESLQALEVLKACGNQRITDGGACRVLEVLWALFMDLLLQALKALQSLELRSTSVTPDCLSKITEILAERLRRHSIH